MTSRPGTVLFPTILLVLVTGACSHTIPGSDVKPELPPLTSSVPSFPAMARESVRLPVTQVPVIIKVDVSPIQAAIQRSIPERIVDAGHALGEEARWTFTRTGEPEVRIQNGLVAIHAEYRGDVEAQAAALPCQPEPVFGTLEGTGKLVLIKDGEFVSFGYEPTALTVALKPPGDSQCHIIDAPAAPLLPDLFAVADMNASMVRAVGPETFPLPVQRVWNGLSGPIAVPVTELNSHACLYGKPTEIAIENQKGTMRETVIEGVARGRPLLTLEATCQDPSPTAAVLNANSGETAADGQPYLILARVPVSYAAFSHRLQAQLFHHALRLDRNAAEPVLIEHVVAADANGRTLIAVDVKGSVKGTIYYWGMPRLDEGGKAIRFPDLQMAVQSKTALDTVKVGYWEIVDRQLREPLRQAAILDLSAQMESLKQAVTGKHVASGLTIDILVTQQRPQQVQSIPQELAAYIVLQGTASAVGRVTLDENGPFGQAKAIDQRH